MLARKYWQPAVQLASLAVFCASGSWAVAQEVTRPQIIELHPTAATTRGDVLYQVFSESRHWIGIYCRPLDDSLRTQLQINRGEGVVIDGVAPESPSAKAGLQRHDLLLSMNEKPLRHPNEILKLVEELGTQELSCEVMRGGKKLTLKVTPAVRPEPKEGEAYQLPRQNLEALRLWVDRLDDPAHGPLHLRGFGPGVMFAPREWAKLPEDVSIQINKTGTQAAKIVVTRGKEKWELTDKAEELATLPKELRPAVQAMLGHGASPFQVRVPDANETGSETKPTHPKDSVTDKHQQALEKRLQELESQMEQLLKELKQ